MNKLSDGDTLRLSIEANSSRTCTVEIVASPDAIIKGLSGREPLPSGHGMLFVFPEISRQSMWMPEMKFPLDIIWLDETLTVVHINYDCKPCKSRSDCTNYSSVYQVKYAIEFKADDADVYGLSVGTQLTVI
jgi:uncharacterized membrane protein (UPF0127 family)